MADKVRPNSKIKAIVNASRINVVGNSGSGKTTFAKRLASLKGIPYVEMDQLFWKPNWQEPVDDEYFPKVEQVVSRDTWVLDGNYNKTVPIKWPRTEVLIFLDLPFVRTTYRVTHRAVSRSISGMEIWPNTGNTETLGKCFFSKESIIWWAMTHHRKNRSRYLNPSLLDNYPQIEFVHLQSKSDVERCLIETEATIKRDE